MINFRLKKEECRGFFGGHFVWEYSNEKKISFFSRVSRGDQK